MVWVTARSILATTTVLLTAAALFTAAAACGGRAGPPPTATLYPGADVSSCATPNWSALRGDEFVVARAGHQAGFAQCSPGPEDLAFPANWTAATAFPVRGAYYQPDFSVDDPEQQADTFVDLLRAQGMRKGDLIVFDYEAIPGQEPSRTAAWTLRWLHEAARDTGADPILYTYRDFCSGNPGACTGLGGYPLWVYDNVGGVGTPKVPAPWTDWTLQQYDNSGPTGRDVTRLPAAQLAALGVR